MTSLHDDPDYLALLRAVRESLDDDLPRLVFADWLEERAASVACPKCDEWIHPGKVPLDHNVRKTAWIDCPRCHGTGRVGDGLAERAKLIRLQCELARLRALGCHERETCNVTGPCTECHRDVEAEPLRRRERELLTRADEWGPYIVGLLSSGTEEVLIRTGEGGAVPVEFARGFPSVVRGPLASLWRSCERCKRRKTMLFFVDPGPCSDCHGRGQAGALASLGPEVLAVSRVEVTDKRASELGSGWSWFRFVGLNDTDTLPSDVFDHLPDEDASLSMQGDRLTYASPVLARAALSAAVLEIACKPWLTSSPH